MPTLYHGTAHQFTDFDPHFTLRGSEPNSGLGIHLTERPDLAAHYARLAAKDIHGVEPVVLIVEADVTKVGITNSAEDYLGRDPMIFDNATNQTREAFVLRRLELQDEGFDAFATEETEMGDVSGCWAVFDPTRLKIVGRITVEEAEELEVDPYFPEVDFEEITLFPHDAPAP